MRTNRAYGIGSPAALPVIPVNRAGAGCLSDILTSATALVGQWFELHALAAAVVTVITDTIKTKDGAPTTSVASTALLVGQNYTIIAVGTTNWVTAGAPANFGVGTNFTAIATATGSGTAVAAAQVIASLNIPAGDSIYGSFQSVSVASGTIIAYRDGNPS